MKYLLNICFVLGSMTSQCQSVLIDCRDSIRYQVVDIDGTLWMAENLIYNSELSSPMSDEQKEKQPNLSGRFYHVNELDSICPCKWKLPDVEDWINYFSYISSSGGEQVKLSFDRDNIAFHQYGNIIDIFSEFDENNPLNLIPTGRWEGSQYYLPENFADYWVLDPPDFQEGDRNDRSGLVHVIPKVYEGKTHIHLREKGITNIHSHKHHLDPKNERQLRKFMVRCVKN